jgi:hypothetical protein
MMIQTIVRSLGGTDERTVLLSEIVVPDVPLISRNVIDTKWLDAAARLKVALIQILAALREETPISCDLFVPNYWKAAIELPTEQQEPMLDLWHLAHDVGKAVFVVDYDKWHVERDGVRGMLYHRPK